MKHLSLFFRLPESRIFWALLPPLAVVLGIAVFELSPVFALTASVLLVIVATVVFLSLYRAAYVSFETKVERNELKNIISNIGDALIVYDQDFRVLFFNPAAETLFRIKAADIIDEVISPKFAERPDRKLLAQVVFPSLAPTLVYRSKAGTYPQIVDISFEEPLLVLRVTTATVVDEQGTVAGFLKIINDRTQEISLLKSKSEFIAVASHQLRTPITEVVWGLEAIGGEAEQLNPALRETVEHTAAAAKKVQAIVEDLLNVAKVEEGQTGYVFEETDPVLFLDTLLAAALPQVQRAGLKLYFDRPKEAVGKVMIDPQKLSMVVSNLLDNAVRYNTQGGQIIFKLGAAEDPRFIQVSVKDTGIGVPAEQLGKLFTQFFRADNAVKFQTDGSGLGLYIGKTIVQAHGGRMWAESEANRGSTFFFTLPRDTALAPGRKVVQERGPF
jgi:signal transduction histidine kinase